MRAISRREFLEKSATGAAAIGFLPAASRAAYANPLGMPIGSQTWPHRQRIKDGDFAGLCKDLADIGVGILELCSPPGYAEFASLTDGKQTRCAVAGVRMRGLGEPVRAIARARHPAIE